MLETSIILKSLYRDVLKSKTFDEVYNSFRNVLTDEEANSVEKRVAEDKEKEKENNNAK